MISDFGNKYGEPFYNLSEGTELVWRSNYTDNSTNNSITIICKKPSENMIFSSKSFVNPAERYVSLANLLREAGFTVPDMWIDSNNPTIVNMEDMTRDGSIFVDKNLYKKIKVNKCTTYERDGLQMLSSINIDEVIKEAQKLIIYASSLNIILPIDESFNLLIHPDKTWELVVLDCSLVNVEVTDPELVAKENMKGYSIFFEHLMKLRKIALSDN